MATMNEKEFKNNLPFLKTEIYKQLSNFNRDDIYIHEDAVQLPLVFKEGRHIRCILALTPGGNVWLWQVDELMRRHQKFLDIIKEKIKGFNC